MATHPLARNSLWFIWILLGALLVSGANGQELMQPKRYIPKKVYGKPPVWNVSRGLEMIGFARVYPHAYAVWDVRKRVIGSRMKVSIEILSDGTFMVYFPLEEGKKTAYIRIGEGFNDLGLLVHELFYGDPNALIKSKALEDQ